MGWGVGLYKLANCIISFSKLARVGSVHSWGEYKAKKAGVCVVG